MSPTSDLLIWGLRAMLVGAVVWVVLCRVRSWRLGVLARAGIAVLLVALCVLNVVAPLNARWGWYGSWPDLASIADPPSTVAPSPVVGQAPDRAVAALAGPFPEAGLRSDGRARMGLSLTPTSYGGFQEFDVTGPESGYTGRVTVWVPPSYATSGRTHPVLEAFGADPAASAAMLREHRLDEAVGRLAGEHVLAEPLIVMPHWGPGGVDTQCVDAPGGARIETWVTQDVPRWVYENFRVEPGRESWATIGAGTGGWCALMATMLHPTQYSAAVSLGGYAYPVFDPEARPFRPNSALGRRYDLAALAHADPPPVALWTLTSRDDPTGSRSMAVMRARARAPLSITPTVLDHGGRRVGVTAPYVPTALTWLARTSPGFAWR